jgi:hypothetical protein
MVGWMSGSYRRRGLYGVLRAGAMEGGEGGAGLFQGDDVVLLVLLVGVEELGSGGSTARPKGRRNRSSSASWSSYSSGRTLNWFAW